MPVSDFLFYKYNLFLLAVHDFHTLFCFFFSPHIFLVLFLPKDAGSQQIGFLLGSCGVAVALTSDACHKGLPKSLSGDIVQFKGWRLHQCDSDIIILSLT